MHRCFLTLLFITLLALPAAGQALGLGELIRLRRVSEKKAAQLLQAKGWELKAAEPKNAEGFAKQTWEPPHNGTTDSTRLQLEIYRSWWRRDYLRYVVGRDTRSEPARATTCQRYRHRQKIARLPVLSYTSATPSSAGKNIRVKNLYGCAFGNAKFRDYGCAVWHEYAGMFPWVSTGTITTNDFTVYTVSSYHNPLMPIGLLFKHHQL